MKRSRLGKGTGSSSRTIKSFFTPAPTLIIQPAPQRQSSATASSNANGLQNNPPVHASDDDIVADPGLRIPIEQMDPNIRMQLEELIFLRVLANQKVIVIQRGTYTIAIGLFMIHGSIIMHGWNTVLQKMPHFVFIIICSNNLDLKILVLMLSRLMGSWMMERWA